MNKTERDILARIESLHPSVGDDWSSGPFSAKEISLTEKSLRRSLDPHHRMMLERYGGNFTFELGPVDVARTGKNVDLFLGIGDDDPYSVINKLNTYNDQIPGDWYPFAMDLEGNLYCLASQGAVYHIILKAEKQGGLRPITAGRCVADSFVDFAMALRLPDWARDYLEQQENGERENHGGQD